MASYNSDRGIWRPAKERAVDINTGELYEGPDREATKFILQETGDPLGTIGIDCVEFVDNIERAHALNIPLKKFLKLDVPPTKETVAAEDAKNKAVQTHVAPKRKNPVQTATGGVEIRGAFGDAPKQ